MKKTGTKERAESILRELPSVVGAFVREDIHGHPREVHLLVSPGPDVRHLARDIRDLLEEHLGISVDQRIISIAQLSGELGSEGETGDAAAAIAEPETGAPPAAAPGDSPAGYAAAEPSIAAEEAPPAGTVAGEVAGHRIPVPAGADSPPAAEPRLVFEGVERWSRDGRAGARVRLTWRGRVLDGEAQEIESPVGRVRAAATATIRAATAACDGTVEFQLEGVSIVRVFDREFALVSAMAASPMLGRRPIPLVGIHPLDPEAEEAAVLASLKAVDRIASLGLKAGAG